MKKKLTIFLFGVLVLMLFSGILGPVKASSDVNYVFEKDIFYDSSTPDYSNEFNIINKTRYTGDFNGTYSFKGELGKEGSDIEFWDAGEVGEGCALDIVDHLGHNEVMHYQDYSETGSIIVQNYVDDVVSGSVEFWINLQVGVFSIYLRSGVLNGVYLYMRHSGNLKVYNSSSLTTLDGDPSNDVWVHYQIDFDCVTDKYNIYENGILLADNFWFKENLDSVDSVYLSTTGLYTSSDDIYVDAIDYSWENGYCENRNYFSLTETSQTIKEVDRYEFALTSPNVLTVSPSSNVNGWLDHEVGANGGSAYVSYQSGIESIPEREYCVNAIENDVMGIYKDNFAETTKRLNVTTKINFTIWDDNSGSVNVTIYDSSLDAIVDLSFVKRGGLIEFNLLANGVYYEDFAGAFMFEALEFNIYIDYDLNLVIVRYTWTSSGSGNSYEFEIESGKNGLSEIGIITTGTTESNHISTRIDWVGIYADHVPISGGAYGFMELPISDENWDFKLNNLVCVDSVGISKMYRFSDNGSRDAYIPGDYNILEINSFSNRSGFELYNMYADYNVSYLENPSLIIYLNLWFDLSSLILEGVILTEGNNTFPLELFYSGVDIDESYFRVDSNNRLEFVMTMNDNNSEYISANFDIIDFGCQNKSISFNSVITGGAYADLQIRYLGSSNYISVPHYAKTVNLMMPQSKTTDGFQLVVYDNDEYALGSVNGHLSSIIIINYVDSVITIVSLGLLEILVPVLILVVIPLAFSKKFGKKIIMPMFLLMAIICLVTELIPIWLFFVLMFGVVAFLFIDKKKGGFSKIEFNRPKRIPKKKKPSIKEAKFIMKKAIKRNKRR